MKKLTALIACIVALLFASPSVVGASDKPAVKPAKPLFKVEASPQIPSKFSSGRSSIILQAVAEGDAAPHAEERKDQHQEITAHASPETAMPKAASSVVSKQVTRPQVEQWTCLEQVAEERGGYLIEWRYTFQRIGSDILARGNKYRVNGKPATWGEEKTVSVIWLHDVGGHLEGTYEETNHKGQVMRGRLFGRTDPENGSLNAEAYDGEVLISRLTAAPLGN